MDYAICKTKPTEWDGKHYLICTHHFNSRSYRNYLMHCNERNARWSIKNQSVWLSLD